jgi:RHS repeat-associated protein
MRRIAVLAVLVTALCFAVSAFSAKEARAGWDGANVDAACPGGGGLAGLCPNAGEACQSWAIFYRPSAPEVLLMTPFFDFFGDVAGYDCSLAYLPQEDAGAPVAPDCSNGGSDDAMTPSGCSDFVRYNPEQVGCCLCEGGGAQGTPPRRNGFCDPAGDPVNVAIGNKYESVTDYESQGSDKLVFTRYYNAQSSEVSLLGLGWRTNFDRSIAARFGGPANQGPYFRLHRTDGAMYFFQLFNGSFVLGDSDLDGVITNDGANVWTFTDSDDTVETYGFVSGQLLSIRTRSGYTQTMQYDGNGNLASVVDSYGRTLTFSYANGVMQTMTDPDGRVYIYAHTTGLTTTVNPDRLSQVTYPDNTSVQYLYEDARFPYALTAIIDENGNRFASWTYDSARRAISSQNAGGADAVAINYDLVNFLGIQLGGTVTVTNALGKQVVHNITSNQNKLKPNGVNELASASTPAANTSITYDGNGYVASETDENGNVTQYQNDYRGMVLSKTEAAGMPQQRVTTYTWLSNFHLPTQIVEPGRTTTLTYDANGNLLTKTQADTTATTVPYSTNGRTRSWSYTYTATGQVASMTDPRGNVMTYAYDASGTLATMTNALGQITQVTSHDASGRPLTVVDANNVTKTLSYDQRGRLTSATIAGATTTIAYDAAGNVIQVTRPDGFFLAFAYDAAHRLIQVSDALGDQIDYTLDALGDRTQTQIYGPSGATLTKTQSAVFDELGRLLRSIGAAGQTTQYGYDNDSNVVSTTDPLGNATGQSFDALNRLIQTAAPLASTTAYGYDVHDNRIAVTDPRGLATIYVYDGLDNLIQQSSPDTGVTVYVLDAAGNRVQETDAAGHVAQMTYDALNRLASKAFPNDPAENITYRYDEAAGGFGIGRLTSVTDEVGTTSYVYDARGNVVQETRVDYGMTDITAYAYDLADHVVQMTYPSGRIVTYTRDAMGRIADVATAANSAAVPVAVVSDATYEPFGPLTSFAYGNNLNLSVLYDQDYRPSARLLTGTATVQDLSYTVDADGNITAIGDLVTAARSQVFQYDALQRLSFANGLYGQLNYGYDAVGNRLSQMGGTDDLAQSYAYAANSNELASIVNGATTRSLTYTAAGNLALDNHSDGTFLAYSYDQKNRLVQVANQSKILATFDYDFRGLRVGKDITGKPKKIGGFKTRTMLFHYDRQGHFIAENNKAESTLTEYIWLDDMPVAMARNGTLYFVHSDHLGTPQKVTGGSQNLVWDAVLRPFGRIEQESFTFTQLLRFPGQYHDTEDKLFSNVFRDYDPDMGRYIESDPIGLAGGISSYGYADGNPLSHSDPRGLCLEDLCIGETILLSEIINDLIVPASIVALSYLKEHDCNCEKERTRLEANKNALNSILLLAGAGPPQNAAMMIVQYNRYVAALNKEIATHNAKCPKYQVEYLDVVPLGPQRP